eukprot:880358-Pyramimonas_sp.AAC.1
MICGVRRGSRNPCPPIAFSLFELLLNPFAAQVVGANVGRHFLRGSRRPPLAAGDAWARYSQRRRLLDCVAAPGRGSHARADAGWPLARA